MKVMLKRMANEQEAQKNADRQAAEKKTKLVDDMSLMKQSELWKMVVGDRVRSLLKYESSRKGKDKGKDKGKKEAKRSTLGSCTVCTKTTTDPCLKIRLNTWCCNRKNQITSRTWGKIMHAGKGKKSGQEKSKTQPQTSKGKIKGKSSGKGQACEEHTKPSQETGKGKGNSKRGFTGGESSEDWTSARWDSHTNARDTYVVSSTLRLELECPVCTDVTNGIALKKQLIFGFPRRGRCAIWIHVKLPVYLVLRLGGSNAQCQTPFQRQRTSRSEPSYPSQSRHWEWVQMEGNSWPEWVRKAGVREHDEQAYCAWQHIARSGCGTSHSIFPRPKNVV